jgi:hypothetical protein
VTFLKRNALLILAVTSILAIMAALLLHGSNNVIRDVNRLVTGAKLYSLTDEERKALEVQLSNLLKAAKINEPVNINHLYEKNALNVYVTVPEDTRGSITRGNSAFVKERDILFIDDAHFLLGTHKIFEKPRDVAEAAVYSSLRAYTVFVLAHEICHRGIGGHSSGGDVQEEYAADSCAVRTLNAAYGSAQSSWTDASVQGETADDGTANLESVSPYFQDLFHGLGFIAEHLLDNDFSVVSAGEAHPIFFDRMQRVVDQVEKLTPSNESVLGEESIKVVRVVMKAASNVLALHPSTVEFDNPIDYAFIGVSQLIYFDRDDSVPRTVEFKRLSPLSLLRVHNKASEAEPKIRYAWLNSDGTIGMLRTDRHLATVDARSGRPINDQDVSEQFGDNSCVKRAEIPREPVAQIYFIYCLDNSPMVRAVASSRLGEQISLNDVAQTALSKEAGIASGRDLSVFQISFGPNGDAGIFVRQGDKVYLVECNSKLKAERVVTLLTDPPPASDDRVGPARLNLQSWQYIGGDSSLAFSGSWLLRNVHADLISASPTKPFALSILNANLDDRMSAPIPVARYQYLDGNRALVNLQEGGALLVDVAKHEMVPISYFTQTHMEQVQAGMDGYWDIHQKHGQRILIFHDEGSTP